MATKIDSNVVIANFFISSKSDNLTFAQIYKFMNIFDNKLQIEQSEYFTNDINIQCLVDEFNFIFRISDNGISIISAYEDKKRVLERYFRLGLPRKIVLLFDETIKEFLQLENESKIKTLIKSQRECE